MHKAKVPERSSAAAAAAAGVQRLKARFVKLFSPRGPSWPMAHIELLESVSNSFSTYTDNEIKAGKASLLPVTHKGLLSGPVQIETTGGKIWLRAAF